MLIVRKISIIEDGIRDILRDVCRLRTFTLVFLRVAIKTLKELID